MRHMLGLEEDESGHLYGIADVCINGLHVESCLILLHKNNLVKLLYIMQCCLFLVNTV